MWPGTGTARLLRAGVLPGCQLPAQIRQVPIRGRCFAGAALRQDAGAGCRSSSASGTGSRRIQSKCCLPYFLSLFSFSPSFFFSLLLNPLPPSLSGWAGRGYPVLPGRLGQGLFSPAGGCGRGAALPCLRGRQGAFCLPRQCGQAAAAFCKNVNCVSYLVFMLYIFSSCQILIAIITASSEISFFLFKRA